MRLREVDSEIYEHGLDGLLGCLLGVEACSPLDADLGVQHEVRNDDLAPFVESATVPNGLAAFDCPCARHELKNCSSCRAGGLRSRSDSNFRPVGITLPR